MNKNTFFTSFFLSKSSLKSLLVLLILTFSIFYVQGVQAEVTFDDGTVIRSTNSARTILVADVDGDNTEDIVFADLDTVDLSGKTYIYRNDGSASFQIDSIANIGGGAGFLEYDQKDDADWIHLLPIIFLDKGDMNGDGIQDIVGARMGAVEIIQYNSSTDEFEVDFDNSVYVPNEIYTSLDLADQDGNGELDMLIDMHSPWVNKRKFRDTNIISPYYNMTDRIRWVGEYMDNNPDDIYRAEERTSCAERAEDSRGFFYYKCDNDTEPFVEDTDPTGSTSVDIDNDGDLDIVTHFAKTGTLVWFERDGSDNSGEAIYNEHTIASGLWLSLRVFDSYRNLEVTDLNSDTYPDIVLNHGSMISVYINDQSGSFTEISRLWGLIDGVNFRGIDVVDVDGDGVKDVVAASDNGIYVWNTVFESDGSGSSLPYQCFFTTDYQISDDASYAVDTGDLDSDGDIDIVATRLTDTEDTIYDEDLYVAWNDDPFILKGEVIMFENQLIDAETYPIVTNTISGNMTHEWSVYNHDGVSQNSPTTPPAVFLSAPTKYGVDRGVVRMKDITATSFSARFQEWDYMDGTHNNAEDFDYMVLEQGRQVMADGSIWEVGNFNLSGTGTFESVSFNETFESAPYLFLTIQSYNGTSAVMVRAKDITTSGFSAALFEQESQMDGHSTEQVSYLAILPGSGTSGNFNSNNGVLPFDLYTGILSDENSVTIGSHNYWLREEKSKDSEIGHTDETMNVLEIDGVALIQQVSSNGGDTAAIRRE